VEEGDQSGEGIGGDGDLRALGDLNHGVHHWGHVLVELVLDGGLEDLVKFLGHLEEDGGVECGFPVLEGSDDVIGGLDVVEGVLVLLLSVEVGRLVKTELGLEGGLLVHGLLEFFLGFGVGGLSNW